MNSVDTTNSVADAVAEIKAFAAAQLQTIAPPTNRDEQWRNTQIQNRLNGQSIVSSEQNYAPFILPFETQHISTKNSKTIDITSEQAGVTILLLSTISENNWQKIKPYFNQSTKANNYFDQANTANFEDALIMLIEKNTIVNNPIFIDNILENQANNFSRLFIFAEKNSAVTFIENQTNAYQGIGNVFTEIIVSENATINYHLQQENIAADTINTINITVEKNATIHFSNWISNPTFIRNNINATLNGENSNALMNGLYIGEKDNVIDNHIFSNHLVPHTESTQYYKGILNANATGIFNGKIYVKQDAQKTNAYQNSKAILNSVEAFSYSKPELEIFADDVKCSHGVAIGQINQKELFYFMARGIDKATAQNILNFAFANEVIEKINIDPLKLFLSDKLKKLYNIDI